MFVMVTGAVSGIRLYRFLIIALLTTYCTLDSFSFLWFIRTRWIILIVKRYWCLPWILQPIQFWFRLGLSVRSLLTCWTTCLSFYFVNYWWKQIYLTFSKCATGQQTFLFGVRGNMITLATRTKVEWNWKQTLKTRFCNGICIFKVVLERFRSVKKTGPLFLYLHINK